MPEKKRRPCDECNKSVTQKKKELADLDKLKAPKTKTLSVPSNKHAGVVGKRNAGVPAGSMLSQEYGKNSRGHSDREQARNRKQNTKTTEFVVFKSSAAARPHGFDNPLVISKISSQQHTFVLPHEEDTLAKIQQMLKQNSRISPRKVAASNNLTAKIG